MDIPDYAKQALVDIAAGLFRLAEILPGDGVINCDYNFKSGVAFLKLKGYITTRYEVTKKGADLLEQIKNEADFSRSKKRLPKKPAPNEKTKDS